MGAPRRGRLARGVALTLVAAIAAGGALYGPALIADARGPHGVFARAGRKLQALRAFALFRSHGDRAVLRGLDGTPPATKSAFHPRRTTVVPPAN